MKKPLNKLITLTVAVLLLAVLLLPGAALAAQAPDISYGLQALQAEAEDQIVVVYKDDIQSHISALDEPEISEASNLNSKVDVITLDPGADSEQVMADLRNDPTVESVCQNIEFSITAMDDIAPSADEEDVSSEEPSEEPLPEASEEAPAEEPQDDITANVAGIDTSSSRPNDKYLNQIFNWKWTQNYGYNIYDEWQFVQMGADNTWNQYNANNTNQIGVAVLDTGVNTSHADLKGRFITGYDYYRNSTSVVDLQGHGTTCAGTIVATANNSIGVAGITGQANVKVAPYRVGGRNSDDTTINIAYTLAALYDIAKRDDIQVVSMSFTGYLSGGAKWHNPGYDDGSLLYAYNKAIQTCYNSGKVLFAASGNDGYSGSGKEGWYGYPASFDNVISMAAVTIEAGSYNAKIARSGFSQYNNSVDLCAPGTDVYTTTNDGGYAPVSGTSFSTPLTAGAAALILAKNPTLSTSEVETILKNTAMDVATSGYDIMTGYGQVKVDAALAATPEITSLGPINNLKVYSTGYDRIKITFDKVDAAINYAIYRSESPDSGFTRVITASTNSAVDTGLTMGKTYYYKVRAYRTSSVEGPLSETLFAVPALTQPKISGINNSINSIKVSWTAVSGATGYVLMRKDVAAGTWKNVKNTATGVSFTDTTVTPGKYYYYMVKAVRNGTSGKYSSPVLTTRARPGSPVAKIVSSSSKIKLSWSAVTNVTGYRIVRYEAGSGQGWKGVKITSSTSFTDTGVKSGKTYYYYIYAYKNVSGTNVFGLASNRISAKAA